MFLLGPGTLKILPSRRHDVDLDFFLMFSVVDENESWHLDENIASFCTEPDSVDKEDEEFRESNRMHAINGYVFGNLPEITVCAGDRVSWHLFGMGSEIDVHTAFFHGQTLTVRGHRTDVATLFPATFVAAEMVPHNVGKWLLTCEVSDHLQGKAPSPLGVTVTAEDTGSSPLCMTSTKVGKLQTAEHGAEGHESRVKS
ncbi:hephaestin-like [Python bivittatus]|uniref:Hephaestin-like n=1 Tax=Python bivittatus TaxID=176946 RepID=A0A9F2RF18_PYTBI|nr:hephaestin-like [Python bivittatus]